jgi:hypothetical protein
MRSVESRALLAGKFALASLLASALFHLTQAADSPRDPATQMSDLEVSVAVPSRDGTRSIFVTNDSPHFHVVLRNRSERVLNVWTPTYSKGYGALHFEVVDAEGKAIEIHRRPGVFLQNAPQTYQLGPGETQVIDVHFASDEWQTFPLPQKNEILVTQMRAVYQVLEDEASRTHSVWTGEINSPALPYRFEDRR